MSGGDKRGLPLTSGSSAGRHLCMLAHWKTHSMVGDQWTVEAFYPREFQVYQGGRYAEGGRYLPLGEHCDAVRAAIRIGANPTLHHTNLSTLLAELNVMVLPGEGGGLVKARQPGQTTQDVWLSRDQQRVLQHSVYHSDLVDDVLRLHEGVLDLQEQCLLRERPSPVKESDGPLYLVGPWEDKAFTYTVERNLSGLRHDLSLSDRPQDEIAAELPGTVYEIKLFPSGDRLPSRLLSHYLSLRRKGIGGPCISATVS